MVILLKSIEELLNEILKRSALLLSANSIEMEMQIVSLKSCLLVLEHGLRQVEESETVSIPIPKHFLHIVKDTFLLCKKMREECLADKLSYEELKLRNPDIPKSLVRICTKTQRNSDEIRLTVRNFRISKRRPFVTFKLLTPITCNLPRAVTPKSIYLTEYGIHCVYSKW